MYALLKAICNASFLKKMLLLGNLSGGVCRMVHNIEIGEFRLTFFLQEPMSMPELKALFQSLTGTSPHQAVEQGPTLQVRSDVYSDLVVRCTYTPGRLDIIWSPGAQEGLPTLGVYDELKIPAKFLDVFKNWETPRVFSRVAMSGFFTMRVDNEKQGYAKLAAMLGNIKSFDGEFSDFMYQINKPFNLEYGGDTISINRLCGWSVPAFYNNAMFPAKVDDFKEVRFVQTTFDINTTPNKSLKLSLAGALDILHKMGGKLFNIANDGDELS
jgi:hypothetical protein